MVGGVERDGHALAACGGHWKSICVPTAYDVNGDGDGWMGRRVRTG